MLLDLPPVVFSLRLALGEAKLGSLTLGYLRLAEICSLRLIKSKEESGTTSSCCLLASLEPFVVLVL